MRKRNAHAHSDIARLGLDVCILAGLLLRSFMEHAWDETKFQMKMDRVMMDVAIIGISYRLKEKVRLHLWKGVILLIELTRRPASLNASMETNRRARLRETSIETVYNLTRHLDEYRIDRSNTLPGFCTPNNHEEDFFYPEGCLVSPKSPSNIAIGLHCSY